MLLAAVGEGEGKEGPERTENEVRQVSRGIILIIINIQSVNYLFL